MHASFSELKIPYNKLYSHGYTTKLDRYTLTNGGHFQSSMSMSKMGRSVSNSCVHTLVNRKLPPSWVSKEARPISLRQLMVFGRSLNEQRLISSANYVRTELPRRYVTNTRRTEDEKIRAIYLP